MKFTFEARTKTGEMQTGTVEAASREAALMLLQRYGLYITRLEEAGAGPFYARKIKLLERVSKKDLVIFSRQLSIMFKSEVPLTESLRTLAKQAKKSGFKEKILKLSEEVEGGSSFSQALADFPELFDLFYINMVKSGEASGKLSETLKYLADHLEREYYFQAKIKGAMMYPALILFMMGGIIFLMAYFVVPRLGEMLKETEQELPMITKIVLGFTDLLRSWSGVVLIIAMLGLVVLLFKISKTKTGKNKIDKTLLKLPLFGSFTKMTQLSRFAENLSTLISGGLPIARALEISGNVLGNQCYRDVISEVTNEVKKGRRISAVLERHPELFPPMFTTMILVGEKTGTLDATLLNLETFYRLELDRALENFLKLLEPLLIMFMGGIVGITVAAILLPLYQTMSVI